MEEQATRVTNKGKSKKIVTILLTITGILGLGLIAFAIYFYTIGDASKTNDTNNTTCGCYYIDPSVVTECGDPRRAFIFETKTVPSTQTCKPSCSTDKIPLNELNSSTQKELYQICQLQTIQDLRCSEMKITDSEGKIITGNVTPDQKVNIEAKFDKEYTEYKFVINNETVDPEVISPDKLTIKKSINDLKDINTINIVATAKENNEQINSTVCRRLITVTQAGSSNVNNLQAQTRLESAKTKISKINIGIGNITSESINIIFSFGTKFPTLTMTKGFTIDKTKGSLEIIEQDLYASGNFKEGTSFSQLNAYEGELTLKAELKDSTGVLGSASTAVTFATQETGGTDEPTKEVEASNFKVSKVADVECVERVAPKNEAIFTVTVVNKSTVAQQVNSIKDKLPLGFVYKTGTSKVDNVAITDTNYVEVTKVGDSSEIVWSKSGGWVLSADQTLTVSFSTTVGEDALTGENMNEVIITPSQIPTDPDTLRASYNVFVAQDCDDPGTTPENTPETGIFDSIIAKIILGITIISTGWYIYNRPNGQKMMLKFVNSDAYKDMELSTWRIFKPRKYFEEIVVKKASKKKS